jgi:SAM-dependent methyltransferase
MQQADAKPGSGQWRILDAGFGTGYRLARIAAALPPPAICLGLDITKDAARQAALRWPTLAFAVADLWTEWPVQDAAVDLVISAFAPNNYPEAARVLHPGGWLAVAYSGRHHMVELNDLVSLMRQHQDKTRRYSEAARRFIGPPAITWLVSRAVLDIGTIRSAILMGPNARHSAPPTLDAIKGPLAVTCDIITLFARKTETMPCHPTAWRRRRYASPHLTRAPPIPSDRYRWDGLSQPCALIA